VLSTWAGEAAKFCPDLRVTTLGQTSRKRGTAVTDEAAGSDLVLTSYAVFRLDQVAFREQAWSALVLDEAQFAKNHQSQVHQRARRLPAPVKLAITGTPMENNLMELWSLVSIVAPGLFPNPSRFNELNRRPIESGLAPERLETLRRRIRPVMLRRTKEAVATDLPPKQEQTHRRDLVAPAPPDLRHPPAARAPEAARPARGRRPQPDRHLPLPHPAAPAQPRPRSCRRGPRRHWFGQGRRLPAVPPLRLAAVRCCP